MEAASICGSDIALYRWDDVARQIASLPFTPGHEGAGIVVQTGPEATLKVLRNRLLTLVTDSSWSIANI